MDEPILGIDAGGSGSRAILMRGGEVTELPGGPPMNALLTNDFAQQLEKIIRDSGAAAVGIGVPGLRSPWHAKEVSRSLTERCGCPVRVTGDGETAQLGAFLGGPGIVVIAGTGCSATGRDGRCLVQAGGHGFLLGDEGSAYWLGRAAARAALRWEDGMGGSEAIHRAVTAATGGTLDELIVKVNTHSSERTLLTVLAPVLTALAQTDPVARQITERAADHLADLAEAVQRQLSERRQEERRGERRQPERPQEQRLDSGLDRDERSLPVAGTGGVFESALIWDRFASRTGATRPKASPAAGAALLAARALNPAGA